MNKKIILYSSFALIGVFISSIGQILLKKSSQKKYDSIYKEYMNPLVFFGYLLFFVATFCSIFAYKVVPLSMSPILESTGYFWAVLFGATIFKEKITKRKLFAMLIIIFGVFFYSFN